MHGLLFEQVLNVRWSTEDPNPRVQERCGCTCDRWEWERAISIGLFYACNVHSTLWSVVCMMSCACLRRAQLAREQLLTDTILKQQADQDAFEQRLSRLRQSTQQPASASVSASASASVAVPVSLLQSQWPSQPTEPSSAALYALAPPVPTPPINPYAYAAFAPVAHMYAYAAAAGMATIAAGRGAATTTMTTTTTTPVTVTAPSTGVQSDVLTALGDYGSDADEEDQE